MLVQDGVLSSLDLADVLRKRWPTTRYGSYHWQASPHLLPHAPLLAPICSYCSHRHNGMPPSSHEHLLKICVDAHLDAIRRREPDVIGQRQHWHPTTRAPVCLFANKAVTNSFSGPVQNHVHPMADVDTPPPAEKKEEVVLGEDGQVDYLERRGLWPCAASVVCCCRQTGVAAPICLERPRARQCSHLMHAAGSSTAAFQERAQEA
jgi:hypothetical protein